MPITVVGLAAIVVFIMSFSASTEFILFSFILCILLQASAAFFLGGNGITPSHFLILTLFVLCFRKRNLSAKLSQLLRFPSAGFFLLLMILYSVSTAYFLPRFFFGLTEVNPIAGASTDLSGYPIFLQLEPSMANITQSIYVIGSFMVFFFIVLAIESLDEYELLLRAFVVFAVANVMFGILDIVTFYTRTDFILSIIRNSSYVLRTGETGFLGLKRIAGSYTEASTYSIVTLIFFSFTMRLWLGAFNKKWLGLLCAIQLLFLLLSTSSTAIVGAAVMVAVLWLTSAGRIMTRPVPATVYTFVVLLPLTVAVLALTVLLTPTLQATVFDILNSSVFDKANSASGIERLALNAQAFVNFSDTLGFGVGVGSARTSSFPLAVMSNVGIPGITLLGIFFAFVFLSGSPFALESRERTFQEAARTACLGSLVGAAISGTSMDLGLAFYAFAAAAYLPRFAFWGNLPLRREPISTALGETVGRSP